MLELQFKTSHFKGESANARTELIVRDFLDDIANFAKTAYEKNVPIKTGRMLAAISESRVDKHPWGWSVTIGIDRIGEVKPGESPEYPAMVSRGTGIFNREGGGGPITVHHGNVMVFSIADKKYPGFTKIPNKRELAEGVIFTRSVKGQQPNFFQEKTSQEVIEYIRVKKKELARRLGAVVSQSQS